MKTQIAILAAVAGLAQRAVAQVAQYGQCGGANWTGGKTCTSGWTCTYSNPYYSQCLPGSNPGTGSTVTVTVSVTTTVTSVSTQFSTQYETETVTVTENGGECSTTSDGPGPTGSCDSTRKFELYGVNQAGAEFGSAIPGELDTDYTWPSLESIQFFLDKGFNTIRIPIKLERAAPPSTGLLNPATYNQQYLSGLYRTLSYIVNNGGKAIIDVHNFGRYNGEILTNVEGFGNFWQALATWTNWSPNIIYDLMNEYNTMPDNLVFQLNQAGISAIRSTGSTNLILVEGNKWSGAWHWVDTNDMLKYLTDIADNMVYEMHQYLDTDGSGTSEECVSDTVGVERLETATQWCEENNKRCFLGEIGTGSNDRCVAALEGLICYLKTHDVWEGLTWWSAGPWWGDYYQSIEPPNGPAIDRILPVLESFL